MNDVVHQGYGDILQEVRRNGFGGNVSRSGIYFPKKREDSRDRSRALVIVVSILVILAAVLSAVLYMRGTASEPQKGMPKEIPLIDNSAKVVESLQREVDIMKRILSGLVTSMETIARDKRESEGSQQKGKYPYPVQVTSDKAHLREGPHRSGNSLTTVEKDTVLLVIAAQDDWLQVFTPKGEEAWISADIVSERR